jgi:hypothetical protein
MRNFVQGVLLFLALSLTGVDAKATASAEENKTTAIVGAWVKEWSASAKKMLENGYKCDESNQDKVYNEIYFFVQEASSNPIMWRIDSASFEQAVSFSKSVASEEIKQCKDWDSRWVRLLRILEGLRAYI